MVILGNAYAYDELAWDGELRDEVLFTLEDYHSQSAALQTGIYLILQKVNKFHIRYL